MIRHTVLSSVRVVHAVIIVNVVIHIVDGCVDGGVARIVYII